MGNMDIKVGDIVKSTSPYRMYSLSGRPKLVLTIKSNLFIVTKLLQPGLDVEVPDKWRGTRYVAECIHINLIGDRCYNSEHYLEKVC